VTAPFEGYRAIRFERVGAVLRVVIAHPTSDRNAVDGLLHHELVRLAGDLRDERDARCIVLTAEGRAFSAGGDFDWFPTLRTPEKLEELRREARRMTLDWLDIEVPIVAALNGAAVGLGASLVLLCDAVVMAEGAVIADPHVKVGLVAGDGGTAVWPAAVGSIRARWHLLSGEPVAAIDAVAWGLANRVVPAADLDATAMAMAETIAANPPLAVRYTKVALNQAVRRSLLEAVDLATALELTTFRSADHAEAVEAAKARRPGTYEGK
jgi:enoyl-CoA hydratase